MGPTNPSLHRFPPGQSPLENEDFALEEEFDNTGVDEVARKLTSISKVKKD